MSDLIERLKKGMQDCVFDDVAYPLLEEAYDALRAQQPQPIATAPDGKQRFLVACDRGWILVTYLSDIDGTNPTHWLPLPTPPQEK